MNGLEHLNEIHRKRLDCGIVRTEVEEALLELGQFAPLVIKYDRHMRVAQALEYRQVADVVCVESAGEVFEVAVGM